MTILHGTAVVEPRVIVTISKWGNSLGLRIPKGLAEDARLGEGSSVDMRMEDGRLVIEPVANATLDRLLDRITKDNLHRDAMPATPVGREAL